MKILRLGIVVAVSLLVAVSGYIAILYFTAPPTTEKKFLSYRDALTGDPLQDHWIPTLFPKSARNIHLTYGVDPTFQLLEFTFDPADEKSLIADFVKITDDTVTRNMLLKMAKKKWKTKITNNTVVFVPKGHIDDHEQWKIYLAIDRSRQMAWYSVN